MTEQRSLNVDPGDSVMGGYGARGWYGGNELTLAERWEPPLAQARAAEVGRFVVDRQARAASRMRFRRRGAYDPGV